MARAHRHFVRGQIYHITHRCHKREFLLKYAKDRHRWLQWLFEAKKRYGLVILNYTVTSNHIHLLAYDSSEPDVIPRSIQLVAGRTGQEYNIRKRRTPLVAGLGRPISCNDYRKRRSFVALHRIHRYEYGTRKSCQTSGSMGSWWL